MGTDIMLTDGDIVSTSTGDIALVSGSDEIIQTAINNVCTAYGELENDPTRGNIALTRRIKLTPSGMAQVESDSKNAILQDPRVADVTYIKASKSATQSYTCDIEFQIKDTDGNIHYSNVSINLAGR